MDLQWSLQNPAAKSIAKRFSAQLDNFYPVTCSLHLLILGLLQKCCACICSGLLATYLTKGSVT